MLDALSTKTHDRKAAGRIGAEAAAYFVDALQSEPFLVGTGRLLAIAKHFETTDCGDGIAAGFFGAIDKLLLRGARADAASARMFLGSLAPAKEAHDRSGA
ncbi:hypothetical protein WL16_14705 [Burkholderia ubonensis]|nr:hypothetical protein WL16_14705 [Burkholderia ubonensis]OJB36086.1 hypothetical protein BGV56_14710 [Burkholderia ubonensis]